MTHFFFHILPFPQIAFASLLLLFVGPVTVHADEKIPESVEVVSQKASPLDALLQKWQTTQPESGPQKQYFFIKRPTVGGQLTYEFKDDSRTDDGTTEQVTNHKFFEKIGLETAGWIYHPALMRFALIFEPEFNQSKEEMSSGESVNTNSFSPDYSMTSTFLETKPYTLNVFANRQQEPVWAAYSGNSESINDSYGATGLLKYKILPTTLGYTHTETDQTGFYTSNNIHDEFNLSSQRQTGKSDTHLISTYTDDQRTSEGVDTQITTFNNNLFNSYGITDDKNVMLDSSLTFLFQDASNFNTKNINLREQLNWQHTPNLQSNYSANHIQMETNDSSSDMTDIGARLTHLLYENLTTNVGNRLNQYNYSEGKENAAKGFLDFYYKRPFSWTTVGLHSGWDYLYSDRTGSASGSAVVTNETHKLSLGEEIYLDNYNVDLDSIIVTNTAGTIVYVENMDYSVKDVNGYVRISRLPFGEITEGQAVSVSYSYLRNSDYDDALLTENYGFNFDLWHDWRFSYNFLRVTQDILSEQAPENLVDDTIQHAEIRYDIDWSYTSLTYEDNNRLSAPAYTRREIQETLYYRSQWQFYVSLKGYYGQNDYKDNDETKDFYGGITTFDWILTRWCKLRVEGYYEKTGGNSEETENIGLKTGLEFRYRIWTARLSYELTDQNDIISDIQRTEHLARLEFIRIMW
jgi:hypothetical protein